MCMYIYIYIYMYSWVSLSLSLSPYIYIYIYMYVVAYDLWPMADGTHPATQKDIRELQKFIKEVPWGPMEWAAKRIINISKLT